MNREIKFRAWDKEEKEMIYNVERTYDYTCSGYGAYEPSFGDVLQNTDRYEVMQFTGLKDINGKEIYEGDVIKVEVPNFTIDDIEYKEKLQVVTMKTAYTTMEENVFIYKDIIGNIYENPELLENKE